MFPNFKLFTNPPGSDFFFFFPVLKPLLFPCTPSHNLFCSLFLGQIFASPWVLTITNHYLFHKPISPRWSHFLWIDFTIIVLIFYYSYIIEWIRINLFFVIVAKSNALDVTQIHMTSILQQAQKSMTKINLSSSSENIGSIALVGNLDLGFHYQDLKRSMQKLY